jgi:hypothetical protein
VAWVLALASGWLAMGRGEEMRPATSRSVTSRSVTVGLVVAQMALAFMLLVGAGLVTRSLARVLAVDPGFDPSRLLTMEVSASGPRYREDEPVWQMQRRLVDAVRAVPGHQAIASQLLAGNMDTCGRSRGSRCRSADAPDADRVGLDRLPGGPGPRVLRARAHDEDRMDAARRGNQRRLAGLSWPGDPSASGSDGRAGALAHDCRGRE